MDHFKVDIMTVTKYGIEHYLLTISDSETKRQLMQQCYLNQFMARMAADKWQRTAKEYGHKVDIDQSHPFN